MNDEQHLALGESHRRRIGSTIAWMRKTLRELALEVGATESAAALEEALDRLEREADAILPRSDGDRVQGLLTDLLLRAYEIGPRAMKGYGELSGKDAARLEQAGSELRELVNELLDEATPGRRKGGGS